MGDVEGTIVYDPILDHWTCALTNQANGWIEIMAPDGQRVRRQVDKLTPAPVGTMVIAPRGGRSCNGCGRPAIFDAATRKGRWGYWCASCFVERTHGVLGVGIGQRLIPPPPRSSATRSPRTRTSTAVRVRSAAATWNDRSTRTGRRRQERRRTDLRGGHPQGWRLRPPVAGTTGPGRGRRHRPRPGNGRKKARA